MKDNVWLAPNAVTHNGVVVENNGFVGTMSLAKYDVGEGEVVAGIPARLIRKKQFESLSLKKSVYLSEYGRFDFI